MHERISDTIWDVLACPFCGESLCNLKQGVTCSRCHSYYRYTNTGSLDLRLQKQKKFQYEFTLGKSLLPKAGFDFHLLPKNKMPEVDFSSFVVPDRLSKEMMSHFPKARTDTSLMLDLGCGNTTHRKVCEHAGFEYVGLDYNSSRALILGDAHSLPFRSESFEFVLSINVLEHIQFPFVMMKEVYRVLKTNGVFIGTVAFLEPFHMQSYYHHTHLGTYNSLQEGGFKIAYISPCDRWTVLMAQENMGLFPNMPRFLSKLLIMPLQIAHKIWWRIGSIFCNKATEKVRITKTAGSFTFIARR